MACYRCHRETARAALRSFYVRQGFAGHDRSCHVLICAACAGEARQRPAALHQAAPAPARPLSNGLVAGLSLAGTLLLVVLLLASAGGV